MSRPTDRTFAELDIMFAAKVPSRNFASFKVDAYENDNGKHIRAEL